MRHLLIALLAGAFVLPACASTSDESDSQEGAAIGDPNTAPKLCAGLRGNGTNILNHFSSLAAITEKYGVVDGVAGGSSGSITSFIYESMLMNPAITGCTADGTCAPSPARVALALKSAQGYAGAIATSDLGREVQQVLTTAQTVAPLIQGMKKVADLKQAVDQAASNPNTQAAAAAVKNLLTTAKSDPDLSRLLNPQLFQLAQSGNEQFAFQEIKKAFSTAGKFEVDGNRLFFRPGLVNWDALSNLLGRVADFYAGQDADSNTAMGKWLDRCAESTKGKAWSEIRTTDNCGTEFIGIVSAYAKKPVTASKRLNDSVGASTLHKLVITSVVQGKSAAAYAAAFKQYMAGNAPTVEGTYTADPEGKPHEGTVQNVAVQGPEGKPVAWRAEFTSDVKFGYWGQSGDLQKITSAKRSDLKSQMRVALGSTAKWKEVMMTSPAEPGISNLVALSAESSTSTGSPAYSAGGWADLAPVLVLEDMGCQNVVYVTRIGDEGAFGIGVPHELGMNSDQQDKLFNLDNPNSSYAVSVAEATKAGGVWCTDWNGKQDMETRVLGSYKAPLYGTMSAAFPEKDVRGCFPVKTSK